MRNFKLDKFVLFRWFVVICQAVTIIVTFPLWQTRETPPLLPVFSFLPNFNLGVLLLASLVVVLVFPRTGLIIHTVLICYALLLDQTRLQPEIVSLLFLMWGALPHENAQTLARTHLIALWFWAGLNKLISPVFIDYTGAGLMRPLFGDILPPEIIALGGYIIALSELGVGVLAIIPRTRKLAALAAFGLHVVMFGTLSPIGMNWNSAVWAWDIALAFAGFALIWGWKTPLITTLKQSQKTVAIAMLVILLSPIGFYFGVMDAYLAHNLYSSNVANADATGLSPNVTIQLLNVPMPPEHRLYEQFFTLTCTHGDILRIQDSRWWFELHGLDNREISCPSVGDPS